MKQSEWTLLHFDSCHESSSGGFVSAPGLHSAIVLRFTTERIQLAAGCRIIEIDIRGIEADTRQVEHMRMRLHTVVCVITVDHVQVKTSAQLAEHHFFISVEEIHVTPSFYLSVMNFVTAIFLPTLVFLWKGSSHGCGKLLLDFGICVKLCVVFKLQLDRNFLPLPAE